MIVPKKLQPGSKVGVISPSREIIPEWEEQFHNAIREVEEKLQLEVIIGKHVFAQLPYSAGTVEQRLEDFHTMVEDESIDAVIFSIGGKIAIQMLEYIDWDLVKKNPKIYTGISDASTLLVPISAKANLITYYGVEFIKVWGKGISDYELSNIKATFFGKGDVNETLKANQNREAVWDKLDKKVLRNEKWQILRKGKATGRIMGGLLTPIFTLDNTQFLPDLENTLLFLETYSGNSETLHQQFESMKLKGVFEKIKGLILGMQREHFLLRGKKRERPLQDVILEVTNEYDFPIVYIPEIGHCVRNLIMPIGVETTIDTSKEHFLRFNQNTVT